MAETINGTLIAATLCEQTARDVGTLRSEHGILVGLAVILVGDNPASAVYVRRKIAKCREVGIRSIEHRLSDDTSEAGLLELIAALNADPSVHGILVQLPLPRHIDPGRVLDAIDPSKDVDGFNPTNVGRLSVGADSLTPCTPQGCLILLQAALDDLRGLNAVIIGKSNIVGKPMALLLLEQECTVMITHILTRNLPDITRQADILVVAAGSPGLVRGNWVKAGATVIDVGISRVDDGKGGHRIVGDVAFEEMAHARAVTPVPGGVGPMTIACLLTNTIKAAKALNGLRSGPQG